jgi:hypothetical protein
MMPENVLQIIHSKWVIERRADIMLQKDLCERAGK